jgi:hypothetical protein
MTSKEKAEELFYKMLSTDKLDDYSFVGSKVAKQCALIAVDEILKQCWDYRDIDLEASYEYWQEVKQEIEKL